MERGKDESEHSWPLALIFPIEGAIIPRTLKTESPCTVHLSEMRNANCATTHLRHASVHD